MASPPEAAAGPEPDILDSREAGGAAVRGGGLRMVGFIAGTLLSTVSAALLLRHLGAVNTGRYVTAVSLVAIVAGLSDLGLTAIGMRELSVRHGDTRKRLAANLLGLRLVLTVIGVIGVVAFAAVAGYGATLVLGVALAGVGLVFQSTQSTLAIDLMATLRLGWVTVIDFVRQAASVALIIALVEAGARLLPFLAVSIAAGIVGLAMTIPLVRGDIPLRPAFDRSEWREMLRTILPYSAAVAAATIYFRIAIVLVSLIASGRQTGYFGASVRIVEVILGVPALLVGAAFPIFTRAARDDRERFVYALGKVYEVSAILGAWVAVSLAVGAPFAIAVVGGPAFKNAAPVLAIQGIGVGSAFVGAVWGYALLSLARYRLILAYNVAVLVLGGAAVTIGVVAWAARGAAVGTAIAETVGAVTLSVVLLRSHPELRAAFGRLPRLALGTVLSLAPALVPGLPSVARLAISTVIFWGFMLATRTVPDELLHELRVRLPRGGRG